MAKYEHKYMFMKDAKFSVKKEETKEDMQEIRRIILALVVIAAFILLSITIATNPSNRVGDYVRSVTGMSKVASGLEGRPL